MRLTAYWSQQKPLVFQLVVFSFWVYAMFTYKPVLECTAPLLILTVFLQQSKRISLASIVATVIYVIVLVVFPAVSQLTVLFALMLYIGGGAGFCFFGTSCRPL